jgi:hypothetical protein
MGHAFKCDDCGGLVDGFSYTREDTPATHHEETTRVPKCNPGEPGNLYAESILVHTWLQEYRSGKAEPIELCPKCRMIAGLRAALQMIWNEEIGIGWENGGPLGLLVGGVAVRLNPEPTREPVQ